MPMYEFQCRECGTILHSNSRTEQQCNCGGSLKRKYGFSFKRPMQEHYNPTVGKVISSDRQFTRELKIASEQATERTGIKHSFVPVDISDKEALGVTDTGLQATHDKEVAEGKREPTRRLV